MPSLHYEYQASGDDFTRAGEASSDIKNKLKQMGVSPSAVRKAAIAIYEGEINMVIHAGGGAISVEILPDQIAMELIDHGPGIADIGLAMQEGYSTAPESIRTMGFGAGMGLPNINRNSDELNIESDSSGTRISMKFKLG